MEENMKNFLTKKEAAKALGVTERTIDNYVKRKLLTAYYPKGHRPKTGGLSPRFLEEEIENFFRPEPDNISIG
jgi:predicted DNA-binding transcriptional regulator AlpA